MVQVTRIVVVSSDKAHRRRILETLAPYGELRIVHALDGLDELSGAPLAGESPEAALVVAHLDPGSTASRRPRGGARGLPGEMRFPLLCISRAFEDAYPVLERSGEVWGWLPSEYAPHELVQAVRGCAAGLVTIHPAASEALRSLMRIRGPAPAEDGPGTDGGPFDRDGEAVAELTEREKTVLELVSGGYSNAEAGRMLGISENTVKFHLSSIYHKLGVSGRTEAVRAAIRTGELSL